MKDLARRFCVPVIQTRPKGARLLEGFSPKLKRRVQLFDYSSFSVWILGSAHDGHPCGVSRIESCSRTLGSGKS